MQAVSVTSGNNNVVTTKATKVASAGSNAANAVNDIINARKEHDVWFNGAFKKSNAELYNLLAKCLDAYCRMAGKHEQIAAFRAECEQKGIKFKSSTPVLNRVVGYVFGTDRRRVSAYARVLAVAYNEKVDPIKLHTWIAEQGGVEEVKAKAVSGMTTAQRTNERVNKAKDKAPALKAVTTVKNANVDMKDAATPYVAAIGRVTANGSVEVLTFITDENVVKAALAAYGAKLTEAELANARLSAAVSTANAIAATVAA